MRKPKHYLKFRTTAARLKFPPPSLQKSPAIDLMLTPAAVVQVYHTSQDLSLRYSEKRSPQDPQPPAFVLTRHDRQDSNRSGVSNGERLAIRQGTRGGLSTVVRGVRKQPSRLPAGFVVVDYGYHTPICPYSTHKENNWGEFHKSTKPATQLSRLYTTQYPIF